ncbi:hypothetical protein AB0K00_38535, partial [Dactylosporangium sp. NPDC049525]|uniref:hypothetical protein n=1 Tax=Dactylosporangium sp. NPDC049525 TaxID=3154730 RepID=UPI003430ED66
MTHGAVRLRARVHLSPDGRVLRPRSPLAELAARSPLGRHGYGLLAGSRGALVEFAAWCRVAAVSPHSVVHLPDDGRAWLPVWDGVLRERLDLAGSTGRSGSSPTRRPSRAPAAATTR